MAFCVFSKTPSTDIINTKPKSVIEPIGKDVSMLVYLFAYFLIYLF